MYILLQNYSAMAEKEGMSISEAIKTARSLADIPDDNITK